jgi:hypothetical protein
MVQAIREDSILSRRWEGTDDEIRAALERLVEMF